MADKTIDQLTVAASAGANDPLPTVQGGLDAAITPSLIATYVATVIGTPYTRTLLGATTSQQARSTLSVPSISDTVALTIALG